MTTLTCRAALAELVRLNEILRARPGEPSADKRRAMTVEYDAASPAAWAAARAALALEAVPPRMLTMMELLHAKDNHGTDETEDESIQRKFCEVNGLTLPKDHP